MYSDARVLLVKGHVVEISFNMRAAVDAKQNVVVDHITTIVTQPEQGKSNEMGQLRII
ncbi:hypothetical protein [Sphingobacterium faecium]|jgi:hypothetical protein|uniref:hypothetical protein n=1 Tax=Sphingobacterium faecium TaxID=34087 RepID=UPI0004E5FCC9|nr:hypothetical protein [Sphingobacterium faecium]WGQ13776.1 hypothetical protein QG727_17300 [Sphingobacterium faecium]CDT10600.1 hypothetical protein BN1088_1433668 [Sphingobacterium sp. PM2-P1-29]